MKNVLYIGWIGYKNLGDELMYDLFKEQLLTLGDSYHLGAVNIEYKYLKNVQLENYDLIVLGGGSIFGGSGNLIHPMIIDYLHHCIKLNKKVMIWGTGIDWAPKSYIKLLTEKEDLPLTIPETLKSNIISVFKDSVWAGIRGPLTLNILEQYGVQNGYISGDPAFLLEPSQLSNESLVQLDTALLEQNGGKIIGVNWGTSFNNIYGQDELKVEDQLVKALNELITKGYHIYLYTVWQEDIPAIERLYSKLIDADKVTIDKTLYNHNELMALMQNFTFTINFKLHANYISLAANVPFIALGYRFKIFDFVNSVNLEDYIISTDEQNITDQILSMESDIINKQTSIKSTMSSNLALYRKRIIEPFKNKLFI